MRHRAFPGSGPEVRAQYQRAGQWILSAIYQNEKATEWCRMNGVALTRAAGETIGSSGGFLVQTDLANAILDIRDMYGAFRRRARIVPMASDSTVFGRRTGGTTASFLNESGTSSATTANLDSVGLTARKIGSLVLLSSELEDDAVVDMVDSIANEIGIAFAIKEDDVAFNGDGTSTYGHMRGIGPLALDGNHAKAKVTASVALFSTLTAADLANLMGAVRASAIPNAAWFCSQTCFATTMCRLTGSSGYLETRVVDRVSTPFYQGFPVILTQKLPLVTTSLSGQVMLAFGDMYAAAALGQRRGITVTRSEDRYLDIDQIAVLGTERFTINVHDMGDNTNYGSVAALVGA